MTVHLIKLSVGPDSLTDLAQWQAGRLRDMKRKKQKPQLTHVTRHRPKRAEEVLDGGSIYWVIKGVIVARQKLTGFAPAMKNGIPHCGLMLDPKLITVQMRPRRPFQGWRYLDPADAPPDLTPWDTTHEMPGTLQRELMALGLL
jgi:hypothetical protein